MSQKQEKRLNAVLSEIWTMLDRGAARYKDPFHTPVLGTVADSGCSLRTVILREVNKQSRTLICHTDGRAQKVTEIEASENISWLFYHPKHQIQLRMSGPAKLHQSDSVADVQWAKIKLTTRLNYLAKLPPGTPVAAPTSGLPDLLRNKIPALAEGQKGRKNFVAIICRIEAIDWLELRKLGNRRACFNWENGRWRNSWLIP